MKKRLTESAICLGDLKTAAIYFDRVIPLSVTCVQGGPRGFYCYTPDEVPLKAALELAFGEKLHIGYMPDFLSSIWLPLKEISDSFHHESNTNDKSDILHSKLPALYNNNVVLPNGRHVREVISNIAHGFGINSAHVILQSNQEEAQEAKSECPTLTLYNLSLIDAQSASWEQIMELRNDEASCMRLRRIKSFLRENYQGYSLDHIQDSLLVQLEDYENARKKHGFNAVVGSLGVLLDAKSLQGAMAAAISTGLFAGPIGALGAGALVEIGHLSLEIAKQAHAIREFEQTHELGFIFSSRQALRGR